MTYKKGYFIKLWAVRVILIALIALWMSTIFGFSAENGEQSQSLSDKITVQVVHILKSDYEDMNVKAKEEYFNTVSFIVRKTGHFGEYGILGVLISTFLLTFEKIRNKKRYIVILITTIIGMHLPMKFTRILWKEEALRLWMFALIQQAALWEWFLLQ